MKRIFLSILISVCLLRVWGQDCETGWDVFGYNEAAIVKTGTNAAVTFTVNDDESIAAPAYYWKIYNWDFGDGTGISQAIYFPNNYTGETHVYDLTNTAIVKNGMLQVTAHLTVNYYKDYILRLKPLACYTEDKYVTYAIPSSGYSVTLSIDPIYNTYPLNKPINLFYNIATANYSATDNLTYTLQKNWEDITNGSVTSTNLNCNIGFYSFTPAQAGTYTFNYILKRYGITVGTAFPLTISVGSDTTNGNSTASGSCLCSDLRPDINLSYSDYSGEKVSLLVVDNSSADFKRVYGGHCSKYDITALLWDGSNIIVKNLTDYPSSGFAYSMVRSRPDVYQSPQEYQFSLEVTCLSKSGETLVNRVTKSITVQPHIFDPSENNINVNPNGQQVNIPAHTNLCLSAVIRNPQDPTDELKWIKNLSLDNKITFNVDTKYTTTARKAEVTLFANGNYDKCVDIVNGEKKSYRTINVYQPTKVSFENVNPLLATSIAIPNVNIPFNTAYYSVSVLKTDCLQPAWMICDQWDYYGNCIHYQYSGCSQHGNVVSTSYYKDIKNIPKDDLFSNGGIVTFGFKDKEGNNIGSQSFNCRITTCESSSIKLVKSWLPIYDIIVVNNLNALASFDSTFNVPMGKSFAMFCENEINLEDGFEVSEGAFFEADIQMCSYSKSTSDTSFKSDINNKTPISYTEKDSVYQPENIVVYPNPSNGTFIIENRTPDIPIISASIINGQGATIKTINSLGNLQEVNVRGNPAGLYLLRIHTSKGVVEKKIIINAL